MTKKTKNTDSSESASVTPSRQSSAKKRGTSPTHLYVRVRKEKKHPFFGQFGFSTNPESIRLLQVRNKPSAAQTTEKEDTSPPEEKASGDAHGFRKSITHYVNSLNAFQKGVPAINLIVPAMSDLLVENEIRGYVAKKGKRVSIEKTDGIDEIYEMPIEKFDEFHKYVEEYTNLKYFSSFLPGISLVGLVSLYDGYLANLLRAYFSAVPGAISGSDKTITFKQISSFRTIDDARRHIIEKEVESVIRNSDLPLKISSTRS